MISKFCLLVEVVEGRLHLFPPQSMSQDDNMSGFGSIKGLSVKNEVQKDGTKFKYLPTPKMSKTDIISTVYQLKPGHPEILPEVKLHPEDLEALLQLDPSRYEYRLYRTNLFNCSYRAFPLLVDLKSMCCYNLKGLFPELNPEDDLGILIRGEEDFKRVTLEHIGEPTVIDYLSIKRMCPMCGVVSNMSKPPKKPWYSIAKKSLINHD